MKKILAALVIASLGLTCSCDLLNPNNDPELPPITTEGKGTFGCLVNGELFLPKAPFGYGTGIRAELQFGSVDTVGINIYAGNNITKQHLIIAIYDTPTLQVGKIYNLSNSKFYVEYIDYNSGLSSCNYLIVSTGTIKLSKFEITNPQNKIIAGTFEFTASSADCNDTVIVTNGRFDINDVTE